LIFPILNDCKKLEIEIRNEKKAFDEPEIYLICEGSCIWSCECFNIVLGWFGKIYTESSV